MTVETHDRCMEIVEIRSLYEFEMFDMVDEGVYVVEVHIGGSNQGAYALPTTLRAEWVPEVEQCYLRAEYDGENQRIVGSTDLPLRVVRNGPQPPIRCDLPVEPCDRCPRSNR